MKKFTKVLALTLAATSVFAMASCGGKNDKAQKTVTIGYTDYAPMNYENENGELVGFDTELAKAVFSDLGYKVRFKLIEWSNRI